MQDVGYRYAFQTAFLAEHLYDGYDEEEWDDFLEVHEEAMAQHDAEAVAAELDPSLGTDGYVDEDSLRSDSDGR